MYELYRTWINKPQRTLLLLALVPIAAVIIFVFLYGYTVPWLDEYGHIVRYIELQRTGRLTIADLSSQQGDHKLLVPFVISLIFANISGGNTWLEMGFSIVLVLFSLWLVYDLYKHQHSSAPFTPYFLVPVSFLLFSLGQRENWIWGNQKCIFLTLTSVYITAWGLERYPKSRVTFVISVLAAIVASWSFLSGNLLWIVIPVAMWLNGYRNFTTYIVWGLIASLHFYLFLQGYTRDPSLGAGNPLENLFLVRYVLAYLGGPFSPETQHLLQQYSNPEYVPLKVNVAQFMGVVGIVLLITNLGYAFFVRKVNLKFLSPWLMLVGITLANGLMLSLGRAAEIYVALASRYITLAIPFWIAVIALVFSNTAYYFGSQSARKKWSAYLLVFNIITGIILSVGYAANLYRAIEARESFRNVMRTCFLTQLNGDSRCHIGHFFYNQRLPESYVVDRLRFLQEHRLYAFKHTDTVISLLEFERIVENSPEPIRVTYYTAMNNQTQPALFAHAPSQIEQRIEVPALLNTAVSVDTAAYLDPNNISDLTYPQDGVIFRLTVLDADRNILERVEHLFDPYVQSAPIPIHIDLSEYAGQVLTLLYETESRESPFYDWSMWLNPRLHIVACTTSCLPETAEP